MRTLFGIVFHLQFLLYFVILIHGFVISRKIRDRVLQNPFRLFCTVMLTLTSIYYIAAQILSRSQAGDLVLAILYGASFLVPVFQLGISYSRKLTAYQRPQIPAMAKLSERFQLTRREQDVLDCLLNGRSNREIESELYISIHTVKAHIQNIYKKMGISKRGDLIQFIKDSDKNAHT